LSIKLSTTTPTPTATAAAAATTTTITTTDVENRRQISHFLPTVKLEEGQAQCMGQFSCQI